MKSRILLVEDESSVALVVSDLLRAEGHSVETASDGKSGLRQAMEAKFDLLILDVMLPGLNGFDLCHAIRERGFDGAILMLTAKGQILDRVHGLRTGADDYLLKPFDPDELLARVAALLRRVHKEQLTPVLHFQFGNVTADFHRLVFTKGGLPVSLAAKEAELLPFDPPGGDGTTLGGLVAADQSGPSRLLYGTARDWVLGMRVVLPDGERVHCGGRVIKNVSGYDMNKLFIRSFGSLGIITEVTFKLLPTPLARASVVGLFKDLAAAVAAVEALKRSFLLPEALELLDPAALALVAPALGVEAGASFALAAAYAGSQSTVDRQVRDTEAFIAAQGGTAGNLRDDASVRAWEALADPFRGQAKAPLRVRFRINTPIGSTPAMIEAVRSLAAARGLSPACAAHAASGVLRAVIQAPDATALSALAEVLEELRLNATAAKGSLVLEEAAPELKARVEAWGAPGSSFAVMKRIKEQFDPNRICSPGRFLGGI